MAYFRCSGSSSSHVYSTTEQKVGTWIDGSDVYEKSYQISLPSSYDASNAWIVEADGSFIEGILSFECTIKTSGGLIMSAGSNAPGWHFTLHRNGNNQLVLQSGNGNELMNGTAYIIIRYTKVTQGGE